MLTFMKTGDSLLMSLMKFSHVSRSVLYETVRIQLRYRNFSARWVKETATNWLNELAADFYDEGIVRLAQRLHKCLNSNGDYVKNKHVIPSNERLF
jgi:hypothetical protein